MKFLLLVVIHDGKLTIPGALEQIAGLALLAQLYAKHERLTPMPTRGGEDRRGGGVPRGGAGTVGTAIFKAVHSGALRRNCSSDLATSNAPTENSGASSAKAAEAAAGHGAASPSLPSTAHYIRALLTLRTAMEIMLDVYDSYVTCPSPSMLETVLAHAVEELHGALAHLGARTRNVMILIKRAEESILRSNVGSSFS
jgi:hypothetical protein